MIYDELDLGMDLRTWSIEQRKWSEKVFGPKELKNSEGPWKHCAKEILVEILGHDKFVVEAFIDNSHGLRTHLDDIGEIADVMFFVNEGLWRMGLTWQELMLAMQTKLATNISRKWPPFDPATVDQPVEHDRTGETLQPRYYASCRWLPGNVLALRPDWTEEQATDWLAENENTLRYRTIEFGWEVLATLLDPSKASNENPKGRTP